MSSDGTSKALKVTLTTDLWDAVRARSDQSGASLSQTVRQLVTEALDDRPIDRPDEPPQYLTVESDGAFSFRVRLTEVDRETVRDRAEERRWSPDDEVKDYVRRGITGEGTAAHSAPAASVPARGPGRPPKHFCGPENWPKGKQHPAYRRVRSGGDGRWIAMRGDAVDAKAYPGRYDRDWEAAQQADEGLRAEGHGTIRPDTEGGLLLRFFSENGVNFPRPGEQDRYDAALDRTMDLNYVVSAVRAAYNLLHSIGSPIPTGTRYDMLLQESVRPLGDEYVSYEVAASEMGLSVGRLGKPDTSLHEFLAARAEANGRSVPDEIREILLREQALANAA
jgi:plasmid stability protein